MFPFLLLLLSLAAAASSPCTVASCDALMKDLAFRFDCDSDSSCRALVVSDLAAIVPVDSAAAYAAYRDASSVLIQSKLCLNFTNCRGDAAMKVRSKTGTVILQTDAKGCFFERIWSTHG